MGFQSHLQGCEWRGSARRIPGCGNVVSLKRCDSCDTAGECKVPSSRTFKTCAFGSFGQRGWGFVLLSRPSLPEEKRRSVFPAVFSVCLVRTPRRLEKCSTQSPRRWPVPACSSASACVCAAVWFEQRRTDHSCTRPCLRPSVNSARPTRVRTRRWPPRRMQRGPRRARRRCECGGLLRLLVS